MRERKASMTTGQAPARDNQNAPATAYKGARLAGMPIRTPLEPSCALNLKNWRMGATLPDHTQDTRESPADAPQIA